jgi:hypothetical protein
MATEKQIASLLILASATVGLLFAAYNCYVTFSNNTLQVAKK